MISFMLAVLGSTIFWAVYIICSFAILIIIIKIRGKKVGGFAYCALASGKHPRLVSPGTYAMPLNNSYKLYLRPNAEDITDMDKFRIILAVLSYMVFWPIYIIGMSLSIIVNLFNCGVIYVVQYAFNKTPAITITFNTEGKDK